MQGLPHQVPAALKAAYLNALLQVGFDTLDFGSFVSPQAVPQMADTAEVLAQLDLSSTHTRLLAIVANLRGAETACSFPQVSVVGYPFSLSETFQQRNTRRSMADSMELVRDLYLLCADQGKELVVYLSMAFGNPYGDPWSVDWAAEWAERMAETGVRTLALADTIGCAERETISALFGNLIPRFPDVTFGAHFHAHPSQRIPMLEAAWDAGCRRFDTALKGYGGCPFAQDELTGNIATETLLSFLESRHQPATLNPAALYSAQLLAQQVFEPNQTHYVPEENT